MGNINKIILSIAILMAIGGTFSFLKGKSIENRNKALTEDVRSFREEAVIIREVNGRLISKKQALELEVDDLRYNHISELDEYKKKLDIEKVKNKRLQNISEVTFTAQDSGTVQIDTVYVAAEGNTSREFEVQDGYLAFRGTLLTDAINYNYSYTDSLYISQHRERKNIFSPFRTTVNASLSNLEATVTGIKSITIEPQKPKLVAGISLGYGFNSNKIGPFIGVTITKPLFTIYK